jgi:hypothetical protein
VRGLARLAFIVAATAIGCGDDVPTVECGSAQPHRVHVNVFGEGSLAAYRDKTGDWDTPTKVETGYEFCVDSAYTFALVCSEQRDGGVVNVLQQVNYTYADHSTVVMTGCSDDMAPEAVSVTGEMSQAGRVFVGGYGVVGRASPWQFDVAVPPGTHTVVASNAYADLPDVDRYVFIKRGVGISKDTRLTSVIDLVQQGFPAEQVDVPVNGLAADDGVRSTVHYYAGDGSVVALSEQAGTRIWTLPTTALHVEEAQVAEVWATSSPYRRAVIAPVPFRSSSFALMPRLEGITFDGLAASWPSLPDYSTVSLFASGDLDRVRVVASADWLREQGTLSLATDAPWFDDAWRFDPTYASLEVAKQADDVTYVSSVSQSTTMVSPSARRGFGDLDRER